ncbi:MAG: SUMF1/EgtB/PvdO family nonheme iron enzyme [Deltaproteobacteria bacterium]|nr:SUMF1/EgtB/PvdO family nonheme iron enzyme [Deltaproteobacteria bacterium]
MSFKDAPPVGYTLQISSNPSGAKIFLQDTYKGTTPLKITDLEKQTYRIRIEKAGYNPIEDKIVFMRDAARIYDLRPLRLQEELLLTPQEELTQQEELLTPQEEALLRQQEEKILKRIEELQQQRTQEQALKQGPGEEKEAIPEGMVKIPAGRFIMGSSVSNVQAAFEECDQRKGKGKCRKSLFKSQMPQHEVYIDEFYIDKYEVTVGDYKKFAQVRDCGGMNKRGDNYPAACVTWDEARSYCRKSGKRLPTEAQWEKASRGGLEGKKYPWGDSIDPSKANYDSDGPKPVGNYEPNEYGVYDMAGNVMEWVDDWVEEDYYQNSPIYNPARRMGVRNTLGKIIRGGAWDSWDSLLWTSFRNGAQPTFWRHNLGFRCAKKE